MPRIVTMLKLPGRCLDRLDNLGDVAGPTGWREQLAGAEALISLLTVPVDAGLLDDAPELRVVANAAVGYENVDLDECARRGILVTNTPGVLTDATADLTLALILATVRRLPQAERSLRAGDFHGWEFWDYLAGDISGATLGIFGMGRIGQAVARRALAFGMRVQYASRTPLPRKLEAKLGATRVDRDVLLRTSDILTLHAPATAETHHFVDQAALASMKRGAYLINTARGSLVDEAALARALAAGDIAGAGLDVYEREPQLHPGLLELDNVILLPHIGSATRATRERMAELAAENVEAVLSGSSAITPVSPPSGAPR
jgi:glyoxylate reductase